MADSINFTRELLAGIDQIEADKRLDDHKLTEAEYEGLRKLYATTSDDPEVNQHNAQMWAAVQRQWRDPEHRDFKFEEEMTPREAAEYCQENGRSNNGAGFVLHESDIQMLNNWAIKEAGGDVTAELPEFVQAVVSQTQSDGRLFMAPRDGQGRPAYGTGFPGETAEMQTARLTQLSEHIASAFTASQQFASVTAKLAEMKAGGAELPEQRSYLHRQLDSLDKTSKSEQWDTLSISVDSLPEYKTLRSAGAALDAEGK